MINVIVRKFFTRFGPLKKFATLKNERPSLAKLSRRNIVNTSRIVFAVINTHKTFLPSGSNSIRKQIDSKNTSPRKNTTPKCQPRIQIGPCFYCLDTLPGPCPPPPITIPPIGIPFPTTRVLTQVPRLKQWNPLQLQTLVLKSGQEPITPSHVPSCWPLQVRERSSLLSKKSGQVLQHTQLGLHA